MKKYIVISLLILIGVIILSQSNKNEFKATPYRTAKINKGSSYSGFRVKVKAEHIYCSVRINGINLINNIGMDPGFMQGVIPVNEYLQNGNNEIAIDVAPWNWFDGTKVHTSDEQKNEYAKNAFCEIYIDQTEFGEAINKIDDYIAILRISIDEKGNPIIDSQSYLIDAINSPNDSLTLSTVPRGDIVTLKNFKSLSRNLFVENHPRWLWTKASKYRDIPNNRLLLEKSYMELREAIAKKDEKKIKSLIDIALYESTLGITMSHELIDQFLPGNYSSLGYDNLGIIEKLMPIDFKNFKVLEYADGRLIRLVDENNLSPIQVIANDGMHEGIANFNHYYSFIDGEFRVVR